MNSIIQKQRESYQIIELALFALNLFSAFIVFYLSSTLMQFTDEGYYWTLAEGLRKGLFSSWYFLDTYYPETLRTPGYPIFLLVFKSIYNSTFFIKIIQLLLYFFSLILAYKLVIKLSQNNKLASRIFLLLTALNIQIPFYSGSISAETPSIFLTIFFMYILITKNKNTKNAILLGLIAGLIFLMRPSFLFFPVLLTTYVFIFKLPSKKYYIMFLFLFFLTLMPFSIWNYTNHGIFKPTPIAGAAYVAHLGYWGFKLPIGYREDFQYNNSIISDLTNPIFVSKEERLKNQIKYENEWDQLLKSQQHLLSKKDLVNIEIMKLRSNSNYTGVFLFPLYNSEYTKAREQQQWNEVVKHIKQEPVFYLKTRIYTFFRVYFTGINKERFLKDSNIKSKLPKRTTLRSKFIDLYPFIITFSSILIGLLFSLVYIMKRKEKVEKGINLLLLISVYQGLIHTPFAVQARYTIPIHFCILIALSVILAQLFGNKYTYQRRDEKISKI